MERLYTFERVIMLINQQSSIEMLIDGCNLRSHWKEMLINLTESRVASGATHTSG